MHTYQNVLNPKPKFFQCYLLFYSINCNTVSIAIRENQHNTEQIKPKLCKLKENNLTTGEVYKTETTDKAKL